MSGYEFAQSGATPQERLLELLPLVAENFTPQLGYKLEVNHVLLSDLDIASNYHQAFTNLAGSEITNEATFVYTYDALDDTVGLESIRLPLKQRLEHGGKIAADCVYLQKYREGFVRSLGLGRKTIADVPISPVAFEEEAVSSLLEPLGLYSLGNEELQEKLAAVMSLSEHPAERWTMREQQTIPLPSSRPHLHQQIRFIRSRQVTPQPDDERSLHEDDYEVTFQTIFPPQRDENMRHINEASLLAYYSDVEGYRFTLADTEYDRYAHPYVVGLPEMMNLKRVTSEPTDKDIAAFVKLLEDFAA